MFRYGFLFLVFVILVITCSETTILLCYFHLCAEDYNWWWRSFLTSGFTAFYFAVYCIHYFFTKLDIEDSASTFLYFGYTSIMVICFFLLTGIQKQSKTNKCDKSLLFQERLGSLPAIGLSEKFTVSSKSTDKLVTGKEKDLYRSNT